MTWDEYPELLVNLKPCVFISLEFRLGPEMNLFSMDYKTMIK